MKYVLTVFRIMQQNTFYLISKSMTMGPCSALLFKRFKNNIIVPFHAQNLMRLKE